MSTDKEITINDIGRVFVGGYNSTGLEHSKS